MAKRKRLSAPNPDAPAQDQAATGPAMRSDDTPFTTPAPRRAPIADVAGEAAATAALQQVAGELNAAKAEGRMIQALPHDVIDATYLTRDRMVLLGEDMEALKASLRARGQQTPIEVVALDGGRYGLISGYRRLNALKALRLENTAAPATVLALVRAPADASEAYTAMVEENEIRVGLSYFERANVVREAVKAGVFPSETVALQALFGAASRSKRSKIKSFLPVVDHLKDTLRYPTFLTERVGLAVATRCADDPNYIIRLRDRLRKSDIQCAEDEGDVLARAAGLKEDVRNPFIDVGYDGNLPQTDKPPSKPADTTRPTEAEWADHPRADVHMALRGETLRLSGAGVTPELAQKLAHFLRNTQ